jgi:hypothetical protein
MAYPEGTIWFLDEADYFIYNKIDWLISIKTKIVGFTGTCGSTEELDSEVQLMDKLKFKVLTEEGRALEHPKTISDVNYFTNHTNSLIVYAHKADFPKYEAIKHEKKYEDEEVDIVVKNSIEKGSLILISNP